MSDRAERTDVELGLCVETVFREMPLEERMTRVASLGFRNVELWLVDRAVAEPEVLAGFAERAGVRITNLVIDTPDGQVSGGLTDPRNRPKWLARARAVMDYAARADIGGAIVCTGNVVEGAGEDRMRRSVLDGLKATVDIAEKAGVTLLLEPLNTTCDHPGYWLTSSDLGAQLCREIDSPRLRLLFDCYHMQIMEGDLVRHIERNIDVIGHFHSAGVPGRHELFTGEVNYPYVVGQIAHLGYRGVFGLEYSPALESSVSLRKTLEYLAREPA